MYVFILNPNINYPNGRFYDFFFKHWNYRVSSPKLVQLKNIYIYILKVFEYVFNRSNIYSKYQGWGKVRDSQEHKWDKDRVKLREW